MQVHPYKTVAAAAALLLLLILEHGCPTLPNPAFVAALVADGNRLKHTSKLQLLFLKLLPVIMQPLQAAAAAVL